MKKAILLLSFITLLIIASIAFFLSVDIHNVKRKQNALYDTIEKKAAEIAILRNQGDINRRYPAIIRHNEVVKDYNICVKIFPNNLYNKILLEKKPAKYLIK